MIKKLSLIFLSIVLGFGLISCNNNSKENKEPEHVIPEEGMEDGSEKEQIPDNPEQDLENDGEKKYADIITEEMENKIIFAASKEYNIKSKLIEIDHFFGAFDDIYIVILNAPLNEYLTDYEETIEKYSFNYFRYYYVTNPLTVYYNDDFYSLQEAYDQKLLTIKDIQKIKENFDKCFIEIEKEFFKITDELKEQGLTEEIYEKLREAIPYNSVIKYLGEYNGAYVGYYLGYGPIAGIEYVEFLDYYVYTKNDFEGIRVVYNGEEYNQQEAYELDILDKDDIEAIFTKYYGYSSIDISANNKLTHQTLRNIVKEYYDKVIVTKYPDIPWDVKFFVPFENKNHNVYDDVIYLEVYMQSENVTERKEKIGEYIFNLFSSVEYIVYSNNEFYDLKEAYDLGLLSEKNIEQIYNDWFKS